MGSNHFASYDITTSSKPQNVKRSTWSGLSNIDDQVNSVAIYMFYKLLLEQQIKTNIFYIRHYYLELNNIYELARSHL